MVERIVMMLAFLFLSLGVVLATQVGVPAVEVCAHPVYCIEARVYP